jgi:hypothetical protein
MNGLNIQRQLNQTIAAPRGAVILYVSLSIPESCRIYLQDMCVNTQTILSIQLKLATRPDN